MNLQEVREAVIRAVPEIVESYKDRDTYDVNGEWNGVRRDAVERPITLADVLIAMPDTNFMARIHPRQGAFMRKYYGEGEMKMMWNLSADLDHQTEETISFIHGLLIPQV